MKFGWRSFSFSAHSVGHLLGDRRPFGSACGRSCNLDRAMHETRRAILQKLIRRFNAEKEMDSPSHPSTSNTDRFTRVFVYWLDLQNAIQARQVHVNREKGCTPWACPESRVREAWQALTYPRNVLALEEFFYHLTDDSQLDLARKALEACRQRAKADPGERT